jgi:glycosyltransferase involved in cell wall biosynthesis
MNKPRIYIVLETFLPLIGGVETQTLAQARSLRARGYEVKILTFHHNLAWLPNEVIDGVPVMRVAGLLLGHREQLPRLLKRFLYLLAFLVMAWTVWQHRHQYDVLQVCKFSAMVVPLSLACRLANKPLVIVVIGMGRDKSLTNTSTAMLLAGPLDPTESWLQVDGRATVAGDLEQLAHLGKPVVQIAGYLLGTIRVVAVILSSRMKSYLPEQGLNLADIRFIPNGVDLTRFGRALANSSSDSRGIAPCQRCHTVVCISKLRYEKGIDVLLQAWRLVLETDPTLDARLIIVGNGPLQVQLERMAKALGIARSVEFTGARLDIADQLHRGSIAVLPSRSEGMPNALLEAMACGLACVATRVSGSEDLIQPGINGLLVEAEDCQGMAQALLSLLRDPALVGRYQRAARESIEKHYSLERVIDRYAELYQEVTGH